MQGIISPDVARPAVELRRSHPLVPVLKVLDVLMRHRSGRVANFGDSIAAASPFARIIATAFHHCMIPKGLLATEPAPNPRLVEALVKLWQTKVPPSLRPITG